MARQFVPMSIHDTMRVQPRRRKVRLTRRGDRALTLLLLLGISALIVVAINCPVYVVVTSR